MEIFAVDGIGEVGAGDDLAAVVTRHAELRAGDVLVVTSKIVAKAAGLVTRRPRDEVIAEETDRVVARRGPTAIVRTWHGLTMAAAGVDASNVAAGSVVPLPRDPDAEARELRARIRAATGLAVAVIIADTAGRAWRVGQTDMAIGCAGILPVQTFAGQTDAHGNPLVVTAPAVADEVAGAAELVSGKLGGRPVVIVRGLDPALLLADDGPGAAVLVRAEGQDLFGLGAREAVRAAAVRGSRRGFLEPTDDWAVVDDLIAAAEVAARRERGRVTIDAREDPVAAGALMERLRAVAFAEGLELAVDVRR
ncbi:coenzyme F420-0:L-glutamate ligase [uncultured Aeromicrobium sp.]|uniref:coenzyme F420-0:L-glutamate ligase n=1 Tax=uncultured Aeromicrobium sp. TaxID=337820 RepID=UPI0025CC2ADA|nr:coenzyme F420-0:L-glutamate ligase [uncultured Aeromicrobium sp.]